MLSYASEPSTPGAAGVEPYWVAASSQAAVLQSPAAGACPAEAACRSLEAACWVSCLVDHMAAFVAARLLGFLQKETHTSDADT